VILDLLVEHGSRLLVERGGNVICVDKRLALVEPLANLAKFTGQRRVQQPLPMPNLGEIKALNKLDIVILEKHRFTGTSSIPVNYYRYSAIAR
jgi:hypothetical protein